MADETTKPTPDPTVLTTEQLLREVERVKDLMMSELHGLHETVTEKFRSVDQQLSLVERQRVEQKADTKAAVDAALTAQKEAVREQTAASERAIAKSEAATTKQIEQLTVTFTTAIKGVSELLGDTKDRVQRVESLKQGGVEQQREQREGVSTSTQLVAAAIAVITVLFLIYASTRNGSAAGAITLRHPLKKGIAWSVSTPHPHIRPSSSPTTPK